MKTTFKERFRQLGYRLSGWLRTRYGLDDLSKALLIAGIILSLASRIAKSSVVYIIADIAFLWGVIRIYSPSASWQKRQKELEFFNKYFRKVKGAFSLAKHSLKDRSHKYLRCPACGRILRVPRGQGNIVVNCPDCKEKIRTHS